MAKELPYFKFEPNEWETGNIQVCTFEERGVFIGLCSVYWSRLGDLPYKLAVQKVCGGNATAIDSLYDNQIIDIIDGAICIDFLNEQLEEFENKSKQNSKNAREGWEKRRKEANAKRPQSEGNAIREEKIKEDKIREDEIREEKQGEFEVLIYPTFEDFWNEYDKKTDRLKCENLYKKISQGDREKIMQYLPAYKASQPDKKYRKDPATFLRNKSWENEIINNNGTVTTKTNARLTAEQQQYLATRKDI